MQNYHSSWQNGTEFFSGKWQITGSSRNSLPFVYPQSSLMSSQQLVTTPIFMSHTLRSSTNTNLNVAVNLTAKQSNKQWQDLIASRCISFLITTTISLFSKRHNGNRLRPAQAHPSPRPRLFGGLSDAPVRNLSMELRLSATLTCNSLLSEQSNSLHISNAAYIPSITVYTTSCLSLQLFTWQQLPAVAVISSSYTIFSKYSGTSNYGHSN
jgi:hypothetical protein